MSLNLIFSLGVRSWPPLGIGPVVAPLHSQDGEVGILKDVMPSTIASHTTCFLIMEHCGGQYIGALLVSDPAFHREICKILFQNCGETIRDIAEIDNSYTL
jgi:hypothetical protein